MCPVAKKKVRRKVNKLNKKVRTLKEGLRHEIIGLIIVGFAVLGIVALYAESTGAVGAQIKHTLTVLAGGGRLWLLVMLGAWGIAIMGHKRTSLSWRAGGAILLWAAFEGILHLQLPGAEALTKEGMWEAGTLGQGGGMAGTLVAMFLKASVGMAGSYIVLVILALIGAVLMTNRSLVSGLRQAQQVSKQTGVWVKGQFGDFAYVLKGMPGTENGKSRQEAQQAISQRKVLKKKDIKSFTEPGQETRPEERPLVIRSVINGMDNVQEGGGAEPAKDGIKKEGSSILPPGKVTGTPISRQVREEDGKYELPDITLLHKPLKVKNPRINKDLTDNVKVLEDTLDSFGVKVKVTQVMQGPAITRYEAQPAPGVKVSKITNLADDIALSLAARDVRIEAPVPGKSVVGIEVPNKEISTVHFREVLEAQDYQESPGKLTLALGKDITGTPIIADLAKMPHLLIAGATGSGKSVCVNTLINSILFKARPDEVKFLMVDPKMVELTNYNGIPHLIAPVVTDPKKAAGALKWVVTEMETRYELFAAAGVRDIARYNFLRSQEKKEGHPPLPFVVVIIDELADLMMVAPGDVEDAICRLAQMARAAGIHLIVATQRPSVDVITGLIKANIPSRIAFAVSSQVDSRTILDMNGAEKLLGRGDMLFYPMGASKPVRVQGCYLGDKEVDNVVKFLRNQAKPEYQEIPLMDIHSSKAEEPEDELFYQAALLFIESGNASVSLLQRRLRIGYTRAARLMDFLEEKGVVGGYEGSKPRDVLLSRGQFEQKFGHQKDAAVK